MINLPDFSSKAFRLTNGKPSGFWQKARQSKHRHYGLVPRCIACYNTIKLYINIFAWQATADAGNKSHILSTRELLNNLCAFWSGTGCLALLVFADTSLHNLIKAYHNDTWIHEIYSGVWFVHIEPSSLLKPWTHNKWKGPYWNLTWNNHNNLQPICMLSNAASFESFKDRPKSFFSMAVLRARTDSLGSKTRRKQKELNCQIIAMVCECVCVILWYSWSVTRIESK